MKLHHFFAEIAIFLCVFFIFALPPLFVSETDFTGFSTWAFPINELFFAVLSLFIFIYFERKTKVQCFFSNNSNSVENKKLRFCVNLGKTLITFGFLCCFSAFMEFLAYTMHYSLASTFIAPKGFFEYFCFFLKFMLAVFYEEVVFRLYLPEELKYLVSKKVLNKKIIFVFSELPIALVFAFAHRYLGWPAIVNAFAAHVALRMCYKKSGNIFLVCISHFLYNLLTFLFLVLN